MDIVFRIVIMALLIFVVFARGNIVASFAKLQYARGNVQKCLKAFKIANKIGRTSAENKLLYGYALLRTGNLEEARQELEHSGRIADKEPLQMRIKSMMALVLWKEGDTQGAIRELEEVIKKYKTTINYQNLGLMYVLYGEPQKAVEFCEEAFEYNSDDNVILDNLAEAYAVAGNYEKSAELYEDLMYREPRFPEAYYGYGLVLIQLGERERGIELIEQSLDKTFSFLSIKTKQEVEQMLDELKG